MKRKDILFLCYSNPKITVDHIESLETELYDAKGKICNLKALLNQNSKNSNKPLSADIFVKKKTQSDEIKTGKLYKSKNGHPVSTLKTFDSFHEIVIHRL